MKTYWLIIGCSVVLTAAVVCIVSYRASIPDSTVQSQNTQQVKNQNPGRDKIPVSKTAASDFVGKTPGGVTTVPVVNKEQINKVNHREPVIANLPTGKSWQRSGKGIASIQSLPVRMPPNQNQIKPELKKEVAHSSTSGQNSEPLSLKPASFTTAERNEQIIC